MLSQQFSRTLSDKSDTKTQKNLCEPCASGSIDLLEWGTSSLPAYALQL